MDEHPGIEIGSSHGQGAAGWRPARWAWLAIAACAVCAIAAVSFWLRARTPALQGAVVTPPMPTYDFSLHDQDGRLVSLSSLRGKAVAMTFLYTHCPDVCPLTAEKLREAYQRLGGTARRVAFVAVSVDPKGDTPEAVRTFLSAHRVEGELTYLIGSFAELKRVWAYYYVTSDAGDPAAKRAAGGASADLVGHTAIVYLIDPNGNLRVFLPGNFDPKDLVTDLKILVAAPAR